MASLFAEDILTIDVGFRYIKVAQIRKKRTDDLIIVNYGIGDTPKGVIKNGAIQDKERVTAEIMKVIKEHKLNAKDAKIVVSGTNIITRVMMVDRVPESEQIAKIQEVIGLQMPINLNEHVVDYKILGIVNEGEKDMVKVFVTAVSKKIVNSYMDILKNLNLRPIAVDIPANSVSKFFQRNITTNEAENWYRKQRSTAIRTDTFAVLDMGSETTIVNILKNKVPEFNRVILKGSSNIDQAIFKELDLLPNQMELAERYKKMFGIVRNRDLNNDLEWQCSSAAKTVINDIVKNVKACFDFYINKCRGEQIRNIYLIGGGSQMKGVREYFEDNLSIPTYPINVIDVEGLEFMPGLDIDKTVYLINVIGIAS
jgi:type IV pilus assembly protein PilM